MVFLCVFQSRFNLRIQPDAGPATPIVLVALRKTNIKPCQEISVEVPKEVV
jgi:hypothetical protein